MSARSAGTEPPMPPAHRVRRPSAPNAEPRCFVKVRIITDCLKKKNAGREKRGHNTHFPFREISIMSPFFMPRLPSKAQSGSAQRQTGGEVDHFDEQELACRVRQHGQHAMSVLDN